MPINTGTAPIEGADSLAARIESEFIDIVRHVTYGRRKPISSGGNQPSPNAQAFENRLIVNCYGTGERQELIVQLSEGKQPRVAAERLNAALRKWFPPADDPAPTADEPAAQPVLESPPPAPSARTPPAPQPRDQLADHAVFFAAHADLVEIMQRHPLSAIEEVWLRIQAVNELGWEVTVEDGRPTFRRKRH